MQLTNPELFWSKVNKTNTCWLWTGATNRGGYGVCRDSNKTVLAHRKSYTFLIGEIEDNLQLDHLCRVRSCVNPDHLEPVTQQENIARGDVKNKTKCIRGHDLSASNLQKTKDGSRRCDACHKMRSAKYRQLKKYEKESVKGDE